MMKIAVFSDAHGNYAAMEAFLNYCDSHKVDEIIGLGDYMTDGPYPQRMMEQIKKMIHKYPCHLVRGNRENYLLDNHKNDQGWKPSSSSGCLNYTAKSLIEEDYLFYEDMPEEMKLSFSDAPDLYICHGIPGRIRGNVNLEPQVKEEALRSIEGSYLLGGHSHRQDITKWNGKIYINPGALGLAEDGEGKHVHFAMLESKGGQWQAELLRIPYDADTYLNDFAKCGLDDVGFVLNRAVKKTIATGKNYVLLCIEKVMGKTGLQPQMIPEDVWEEVAKELEL